MRVPIRILVTDAEQRSALAVIRSLGRAGYSVFCCSARAHAVGASSRFTVASRVVADPLANPESYTRDVALFANEAGARIVIPVTDASILAFVEHRSLLTEFTLPLPLDGRYQRIADKEALLRSAASLGIPIPASSTLHSPADAHPTAFPVVLKPARSVSGTGSRRQKFGVSYASTPEELVRRLQALPKEAFPVMLQQLIEGPGVGVFLLVQDGKTRLAFSHLRLREKPPSGGVCVLGESRTLDPDLLAKSEALLREFNWEGVAMIEFKLDETSGTCYLMEVNPRFWGSLQLAIHAGCDFPAELVAMLSSQERVVSSGADAISSAGRPPSYRAGIRSRWFWGDVDHLIARVRQPGARVATHGETAATTAGALLNFLKGFGPGVRSDVFSWTDPRPFVTETLNWLRRVP